MYFLQQRPLQRYLFRIRSHNYVYLILLLKQEEEHNQLFRQLSLVRSIHFVHFIHPYLGPLPKCDAESFGPFPKFQVNIKIQVKPKRSLFPDYLSVSYDYGSAQLGHTMKTDCTKFQTVDLEICSTSIFQRRVYD